MRIVEVGARDIEFEVTVAGEIAPAEQVSVRPEINGRIASLHVAHGYGTKEDRAVKRCLDLGLGKFLLNN